jgi:hypothetical protein
MHKRTVHNVQNISVRRRRRNHQHLIAPLLKVFKHAQDGVRDSVHQWQE